MWWSIFDVSTMVRDVYYFCIETELLMWRVPRDMWMWLVVLLLVSSDAQQSTVDDCRLGHNERHTATNVYCVASFGRHRETEMEKETPIRVHYIRVGCYQLQYKLSLSITRYHYCKSLPATRLLLYLLFAFFFSLARQTNNSFITSRLVNYLCFIGLTSMKMRCIHTVWLLHMQSTHWLHIRRKRMNAKSRARPSFVNEFLCDQWFVKILNFIDRIEANWFDLIQFGGNGIFGSEENRIE